MNMQKLMQQAQRMQRDLESKKKEIAQEEFVGKYEWVEVKLNGNKDMVSCKINQESLDEDDIEMLEDFIVLAMKDALEKVNKEYEDKMGQYAGMFDGLM